VAKNAGHVPRTLATPPTLPQILLRHCRAVSRELPEVRLYGRKGMELAVEPLYEEE
jgi:hypothetical protein